MSTRPHEEATIWRPPAGARRVALSPAATRVAVLDAAGELTIFAPDRPEEITRLTAPPEALAIAVSDDGEAVAVVDTTRQVHVVRAAVAGAPMRTVAGLCGSRRSFHIQGGPTRVELAVAPHELLFAPDGQALVVASYDVVDDEEYYGGGTVDTTASAELCRLGEGTSQVLLIATRSRPITYRASDADADAAPVVAAAFSPDGRWLALLQGRGGLSLRACAGEAALAPGGPAGARVDAFAFVPDEPRMLLARGSQVTSWGVAEGDEVRVLSAAADVVAIASRGDQIVCLDPGGDATLFAASGEPLGRVPRVHPSRARVARWVRGRLVIGCEDGALVIWP